MTARAGMVPGLTSSSQFPGSPVPGCTQSCLLPEATLRQVCRMNACPRERVVRGWKDALPRGAPRRQGSGRYLGCLCRWGAGWGGEEGCAGRPVRGRRGAGLLLSASSRSCPSRVPVPPRAALGLARARRPPSGRPSSRSSALRWPRPCARALCGHVPLPRTHGRALSPRFRSVPMLSYGPFLHRTF